VRAHGLEREGGSGVSPWSNSTIRPHVRADEWFCERGDQWERAVRFLARAQASVVLGTPKECLE